MKTIKQHLFIISGAATGFLQMFPIMYELRGTYSFSTMTETYAWLTILLGAFVGYVGKKTSASLQQIIATLLMMGFGIAIILGPWSPLRQEPRSGYFFLLLLIMLPTAFVSLISSQKKTIVIFDSLFLGILTEEPGLSVILRGHFSTFFNLLQSFTLGRWGYVLGFTLVFGLLIATALWLGEFFLGSKKRSYKRR